MEETLYFVQSNYFQNLLDDENLSQGNTSSICGARFGKWCRDGKPPEGSEYFSPTLHIHDARPGVKHTGSNACGTITYMAHIRGRARILVIS